jgi:pyruvate/2-oxoglutarate dehydrogenase complex dihydrolipoamide acyltransferase (E2) component
MQHIPRVVLTLTVGAFLAVACKREAPPAAQEARAPSTAQPPAAEAAPAAAAAQTGPVQPASAPAEPVGATPQGSDRYSEKSFELVARPSGGYAAGQEGKIEIVLDAKPPFHTNKQYPYKFKTKESAGVKFPQPVVTKDQAKLEEQKLTMLVPFVADSAGKKAVSGQFAFSVCTDETCLMEKRELTLVVDVK